MVTIVSVSKKSIITTSITDEILFKKQKSGPDKSYLSIIWARAFGVPVGRRSGGQLATTLVATNPDPEPDYNLNSMIDT